MTDVKRQLTIRTGAVKRLSKELNLYKDEKKQEQLRVEKLKASGADSHDVKHAVICDSKARPINFSYQLWQRQSNLAGRCAG